MTSEEEDALLEVSEPVELKQWSEVLEARTCACWPIVAAASPPSGVLMGALPWRSICDIAATKYKVIGDRGELRDYYDLMRLTANAGIDPQLGLRMYCERYGVGLEHPSVAHIVIALGSFDDVADDPWLSESDPDATLDTVSSYWQQRQPTVAEWLASMLD